MLVIRAAWEKEQNSSKTKKKKEKEKEEAATINPEHFSWIKKSTYPSIRQFMIMPSALR